MPHNHLRLFLDQVVVVTVGPVTLRVRLYFNGNSEWNTDASNFQVC